jgi:hypothetical protein
MSTEAKISHLFVEFLISLKKKGKFLHPPSNLTNSIAGQTCIPENNAKENFKKLKGIFLI